LTFGKPVTLTRNQTQAGIQPDALTRIFQGDPAKLPEYVGMPAPDGSFVIYKIVQVLSAPPPDAARLSTFSARVGEQLGRELFAANLASLKAKADVKINQAALEKDLNSGEAPPATSPPLPGRRR
jgi:hypothetical protein